MAIKLGGSNNGEHLDEAGDDIVAEINITPLTDVFLVLLVIFMVTTTAMNQMGMTVNLPQASNQSVDSQPDGVIVTLLPSGEMQVNGHGLKSGDFSGLEMQVKQAFQVSKSKLVIIEGDRQAFLGNAIEVMDRARRAGAERFAIATKSN